MFSVTAHRWRQIGAALGILWACCVAVCALAADGYSEDTVKAVFLARFEGYVQWPPPVRTSFTIAVLGADGVEAQLQRLLSGAHAGAAPVVVRKIRRIADLGDAAILFVGRESPVDLRLIVAATSGRPILLVTDEEHGLDAGAAVNFLLVDQRLRFEVSVVAAERAGLRISSELLSVAARVQGGQRRTDIGCGSTGGSAERGAACPPRVTHDTSDAGAGESVGDRSGRASLLQNSPP